jgi:hypothetical protein
MLCACSSWFKRPPAACSGCIRIASRQELDRRIVKALGALRNEGLIP